MHDALSPRDLIGDELRQRAETGYDVADLAERVSHDPLDADLILDELNATQRSKPWPYVEPDTLADILAELEPDSSPPPHLTSLSDRIHGAWLGRVAGCMTGKPVERGDHWTSDHIRAYLELAEAYPLDDYIPALEPMPAGYEFHPSWPSTTRHNIHGAARDDDIDYTVLNLMLLEAHGTRLTTEDIGTAWLRHLPCLQTYTAERAAYRNLVNGIKPPNTATWRNPYREWIGAAIRGDMFGYIHPGRPRAAAVFAHRDARLSHTGNGIYAEMWIAALVAAAFTGAEPRELVRESLRHIPPRSRLAEAISSVVASHRDGRTWDAAVEKIQREYGHYEWVHAVNNACLVAAALLWSGGDWAKAVGLAVEAGWDTDSNGATVGSVMGAALGRTAIPDRFSEPLQDTVRPGLFGLGDQSIAALAERTLLLARGFCD